ncbi:MAG: ESX secretion-associated protein EspG, partial [Labedaea sp.]
VDVLAQTLDVNLRLFPFEIPSVGRMQADRTRIAKAVFVDLNRRGLIQHGEIEPELRQALHALAEYRVAVAAMGTLNAEEQLFARASANGEIGVLAVQRGQQLRVEQIRPTALAVTMVGLLPKVDAGAGQSVTLTKPATAATGGRHGELVTQVHGSIGPDPVLRIAEGYLSRPRTGSGFFAVSAKSRHGREVRAGEIGWFDTDVGRYLHLSPRPDSDGRVHGTYSPADSARLTQQLGQLIDSVTRQS